MHFLHTFDLWTVCLTVLLVVPYSSFFEYGLHRFVMHKRWQIFGWVFLGYPHQMHHETHHGIFPAGSRYLLSANRPASHKSHITMAWWNWLVLVPLAGAPWIAIGCMYKMWSIMVVALATITLYYATYEFLHWCMHVPKDLWFKKTWLFRWLDGHHHKHHERMGTRFNVVLPLADLFFAIYVKALRLSVAWL